MTPRFLALALICFPVLVHAQQQTWVSGVGDDVNPGSRTAPCKTFAGTISKTAAGGAIGVLDPGGFGTVTITKSITIDGGTAMASILASLTNGINVNAGATDVVTLRNLDINGAGTTIGLNGINILAAGAVHIENCRIYNFSQSGIAVAPATPGAQIFIKDCSIHNCSPNGILIAPQTGVAGVTVHISNSRISASGNGVNVAQGATVLCNKTVCDGNTGAGFITGVAAGDAAAKLDLVNCQSSNNAVGVQSQSTVVLTESQVFNNTGAGLKLVSPGKITSFSNNSVSGNNPDGTTTTIAPR